MTTIPVELVKLNPEKFSYTELHKMPEAQGIYGIVDESLGLEYLGISRNIRNRFTHPDTGCFYHQFYDRHLRNAPPPFGLSDCFVWETHLVVCVIDEAWEYIERLERALIRKYHPRSNKRHNPFASKEFLRIHESVETIGRDCNFSLSWDKDCWDSFHRLYMQESRKMRLIGIDKYLQDSWRYDYTPFKEFFKKMVVNNDLYKNRQFCDY